ncbi:hypothetical protein [Frigoriflavimonas asaccharolytica]|uniref:Uncharacterized protein n=1 Tax=Frigoriflavimonas asaccharolytica TaxID=2735899 RepID=A0A8J8K6T9_9FLAO|nr:hypothetical protein [Frigoriflavimonas asaccharolytica]NRS94110.1 hypothetical protein [Frigoriflavimonas asaccharolytica]
MATAGVEFTKKDPIERKGIENTQVKSIKLSTPLDKGSANLEGKINRTSLQLGMLFGKTYQFQVETYTTLPPQDKKKIKWKYKYHSLSQNKWIEHVSKVTGEVFSVLLNNKDICGRTLHVMAYINDSDNEGYLKIWHHNRFRWFNRKTFEAELKERTDAKMPWKVNQAGTSLCGMACIFYLFAKEQPEAYKKFAKDLFRTGEASHNNYTAKPSEEVLSKFINGDGFPVGCGGMPIVDFVTMASTRNTDNPKYKGGNEEVQAINWPWVVKNLSSKLLGYTNIKDKGTYNPVAAQSSTGLMYVEDRLNEIENYHNQGYKVILMVDSDLIQDIYDIDGMDYHWIVYDGGLNIEKPKSLIKKYFENLIMFDVYSWGSNPKDKSTGYLRKKISINHFKLNYYGYIICK